MSQQLLGTPLPRSPLFISKPKELGGCIDGGHHHMLLALIPQETMMALHLVHPMITT
jgi:hypothetical protein